MTYRDRREAKAERLREWAAKREAKASASFDRARQIGEMIPFGQPILAGHHSEGRHRRDLGRIDSGMRAGVENQRAAESMLSRAANIEAAASQAIYSDDPDAVEALEVRIANLEAQREDRKAANAAYRKAHAAELKTLTAFGRSQAVPYPSYSLANLSGDIKRNRDRLEQVKARQARADTAEASGGVTVERIGDYVRVTFAQKPSRDVLNELKAAGFRWGGGCWTGTAANLPATIEATR